jgi:small subunit ribosomal protein S21e
MQNEDKKVVDLYIPRKCSATNRIIGPKDCRSVQINIAEVDENDVATKGVISFYISGDVRRQGLSDGCLNRLCKEKGLLSFSN